MNQTSKAPDIQIVRIPWLGESTARGTVETKDQRFVNGYFDVLKNSVTGKMSYFFTKRPGLTIYSQLPIGADPTPRGMYVWRGDFYYCYGTKLYRNGTELSVTLTSSSGPVGFAETRPSASAPVLCVNDGTALYVISTTGAITVLNNVAITSSSVANPTVITTAAAHNLTTGNQVIIRNHSGSTPSINDTLYTVTVLTPTTFTIPVNVTVGGTGGTIGVFPTPNLVQLVYFDGYIFVLKSDGSLCNCELDDPREWDPTKFIVPIMDNGAVTGIARQGNFFFVFGDKWLQGYFNAANALGSPLSNYESAMLQIGCESRNTIVSDEGYMTWIGSALVGGFTVYRLTGNASYKDIGDPAINRVINSEGSNLSNARASLIRVSGHVFYILTLVTANRTFVYDYDLDVWYEWEGTDGGSWPILGFVQVNNALLGQHMTNGNVYTVSPTTYQDAGANFTVLARTSRIDLDTNDWKFVQSLSLLGDIQATTTPVSLQYSDDDYVTLSTARTLDMVDYNPYATNLGRFRRRSWQISYAGNNPLRTDGFQMKYRLGTN